MELIGSYGALGYTVEAYFPTNDRPDEWTIYVLRDGAVLGEFHAHIASSSVYGIDHRTMVLVEAATEAALAEVTHTDANCFAQAA